MLNKYSGILISFEGVDGSGKSVQAAKLAACLKQMDYPVILTRQPGGTKLGEKLRSILTDTSAKTIRPITELFLYSADRSQHVKQVILPALKNGKIIISDRYSDACLAYQGYGRGLDLDYIRALNKKADGGAIPQLTILLDIKPANALMRKRLNGIKPDRLEKEKLEFHQRIRYGYLKIAENEKERFRVIAAEGCIDSIHKQIIKHVMPLITTSE